MPYLIDTNVLSEVVRADPDPGVVGWLRALGSTEACLSVLTLGEIARGVELLEAGARRERLGRWLEVDLPDRFRGRIFHVDGRVAQAWGGLDAQARRSGRPLPAIDGLLLATAHTHRLTFVTRNERDCGDRGVPVLNPWVR